MTKPLFFIIFVSFLAASLLYGCEILAPTYTLEIEIQGKGSVHRTPLQGEYTRGTTVTLEAVAETGWKFSHWQGDRSSENATIVLDMNSNIHLVAVFERKMYDLSLHVQGEGWIDKDITHLPGHTYPYETRIRLTAIPEKGWEFSHWEGDAHGSNHSIYITLDEDKDITAVFQREEYSLSIDIHGQGAVQKDPDRTTYFYGEIVTLTAIPHEGWEFYRWHGYHTNKELEIVMEEDTHITAEFTIIDGYELNISTVGEGHVERIPHRQRYIPGETVTLQAHPQTGWTFKEWRGDVTGSNPSIDIIMDEDTSITAVFQRERYSLTLYTQGQGSVRIDPEKDYYYYGDTVILQAQPDTGWELKEWRGDARGSHPTIEIVIEGNTSITAVFQKKQYILRLNIEGQGSVDRDPDKDYYYHGDRVTLTARPNTGWTFKEWRGDVRSTRTTIDVIMDGDKYITAEFQKKQYTLTIVIEGQGTVTKDPKKDYYYHGDRVTLTANPRSDWFFSHWAGDLAGEDRKTEIFMTGNKRVEAHFVPGLLIQGELFTEKNGNRSIYEGTISAEGYSTISYYDGTFELLIPHPRSRFVDVRISREGYRTRTITNYVFHYERDLDLGRVGLTAQDLSGAYGNVEIAATTREPGIPEERPKPFPLPEGIGVQVGPNEAFTSMEPYHRLIVVYHDWHGIPEDIHTLHAETGVEVLTTLQHINGQVIKVQDNACPYEIKDLYRENPQVNYIEFDYPVYLAQTRTPNDEFYSLQWHYPAMYLQEAWYYETGSRNVRVAVIDSGIIPHPDLFPSTANPGNINWSLARSFVDDTPYDIASHEDQPSHGTHIAGIIGALTNNQEGVAAVSWRVDLLPLKALEGTAGYTSNIADAIHYAANRRSHIINLSLVTSHSFTLRNAVEYAQDKGSLLIAAAGNTGSSGIGYPARYDDVLAVGAIDTTGSRASYSSYGPELDLMGPGGRIISKSNPYNGILSTSGYYEGEGLWTQNYMFMEGTSMATAHVSGVAALMIAHGVSEDPLQIREGLLQAGMRYPNHDQYMGYGLLDAPRALEYIPAPSIPMEEVIVFAGRQVGNTIYIYSEITYPYKAGNQYHYDLQAIDPGSQRVFAWYDANKDGTISPGDYFTMSSVYTFRSGRTREIHLIMEEYSSTGKGDTLEIITGLPPLH